MTDVVERPARGARTRSPGRQAEPASAVAARALDLVGEDPAAAMALAEDALVLARRQRDGAATTTALRAQGLAARATGELAVAEAKLRRAVRLALRRGDDHSAAEARMTLSFVLLDAGQVRAALRQSGLASTVLDGVEGARLLAQHGLILQRCGRREPALDAYEQALSTLRLNGDLLWQAKVLSNRGVLEAYQGSLSSAESDLLQARDLQEQLGRPVDSAMSTWNLGFVASSRGDAVAALRLFDAATSVLDDRHVGAPERAIDRAEVLLSVGMSDEALTRALQALEELLQQGQRASAMECRLLVARAALISGDYQLSLEQARVARRYALIQQREAWALVARHLEVRALEGIGGHGTGLIRRALQLAESLHRVGWLEYATDARLTAARLSLAAGYAARAAALLNTIVDQRGAMSDALRVQRAYALALLRHQQGDVGGALSAARRALDLVERRRSTVASIDMQLGVASSGLPIAQLAVEIAAGAGSATSLLGCLESWRAQNVRVRPVRPPKDVALSQALVRLRQATADAMEARLKGEQMAALESAVRKAEREVVDRSRRVRPRPRVEVGVATTVAALREDLADATLVELFAIRDDIGAVVVRGSACRPGARGHSSSSRKAELVRLGSLRVGLREVEHLQFALARLADGRGSAVMLAAARESAEVCAERLDAMLLRPLQGRLGDGPCVLVPSDGLHAVPWSLLATTARQPLHLVPSVTAWRGAKRRFEADTSTRSTVVVTGPGLEHAQREAAAVAHAASAAHVFAGGRATTADVLRALSGARVAHIAAHGRFESDNPMMSSLELADGPLMVYDLEDLDPPPLQVVLAACHSGSARLHAGHELLGLAHALLWFGSSGVVATSLPAPDGETAELMGGLHQGLARGRGVAEALWEARQRLDISSPAGFATAAGFQAYGF